MVAHAVTDAGHTEQHPLEAVPVGAERHEHEAMPVDPTEGRRPAEDFELVARLVFDDHSADMRPWRLNGIVEFDAAVQCPTDDLLAILDRECLEAIEIVDPCLRVG